MSVCVFLWWMHSRTVWVENVTFSRAPRPQLPINSAVTFRVLVKLPKAKEDVGRCD